MSKLAIHAATERVLRQYTERPSHAMILIGPTGSGKRSVAYQVVADVLGIDDASQHQYVLRIAPEQGKAIAIEAVRTIERFLQLKVPSNTTFNRAVVVEDAHLLGTEAQNALLKTLEEPPEGTILVMTATHTQALLPTILSRSQTIAVHAPDRDRLQAYFIDASPSDFARAYSISGGMPGLLHALLHEADHPLLPATEQARMLLKQSSYERLLAVDSLSKQRQLSIDLTFILQQMARISLQTASGPTAKRWQGVLTAAYEANELLVRHTQPKLTLTKLMLSL
jgi:DNA polymerase III, delta subunit